MTTTSIFSPGIAVVNDVFSPEEKLRCRLGEVYEKHPIMSRIVAVPIQALSGIVKTFLFPVWSAVSSLVLPIVMAIRACQGKDNTGHLQAWVFSLLGTGLFVGFVSLSVLNLSLLTSSCILLGAMSITIAIHVHRGIQTPPFFQKEKLQ